MSRRQGRDLMTIMTVMITVTRASLAGGQPQRIWSDSLHASVPSTGRGGQCSQFPAEMDRFWSGTREETSKPKTSLEALWSSCGSNSQCPLSPGEHWLWGDLTLSRHTSCAAPSEPASLGALWGPLLDVLQVFWSESSFGMVMWGQVRCSWRGTSSF